MSSQEWFNLIPLIALNIICYVGIMVYLLWFHDKHHYTLPMPSEKALQERREHLSMGLPSLINFIFGIVMIGSCIVMSSILINRSIRLLRQHKRLSLTTIIVSAAQIFIGLPFVYILVCITYSVFRMTLSNIAGGIYLSILMSVPLIISIVQVWAMTMIPVEMKGAKIFKSLLIGSSVTGILAYWWWIVHAILGAYTVNLFIDVVILRNKYTLGNTFFEELWPLYNGQQG